jgi:hypothetical protein
MFLLRARGRRYSGHVQRVWNGLHGSGTRRGAQPTTRRYMAAPGLHFRSRRLLRFVLLFRKLGARNPPFHAGPGHHCQNYWSRSLQSYYHETNSGLDIHCLCTSAFGCRAVAILRSLYRALGKARGGDGSQSHEYRHYLQHELTQNRPLFLASPFGVQPSGCQRLLAQKRNQLTQNPTDCTRKSIR